MPDKKIRVLIVEDTLVGQSLLKGLLAEDPVFEVIGISSNGKQAIEFIKRDRPDVVSMDMYMPVMDGVDATRIIMRQYPVPIAIVSSFYNSTEVQMSFKILEAGALTILPRPFGPGHPQFAETSRNYRRTLKMLSEIKVKALNTGNRPRETETQPSEQGSIPGYKNGSVIPRNTDGYDIIVIGASAGGPQATSAILKDLDKSLKCPVLIVQHIDRNFAEGYCDWLNTSSAIPVHIAKDGEKLLPGHGYLPPGDHHLGLRLKGVAGISHSDPERGLRPAVSYLFRTTLAVYGNRVVSVLLSGMGEDGAAELKRLHDAGALTIAQDANSALVHGMPGEAIKLGGASTILNPKQIAAELNKLCL